MLKVDVAGSLGEFDYAVSFETEHRVIALFGVSGAGKSTVINTLSGVLLPDYGHISIDDSVFLDTSTRQNISPRRRRIGQIFQDGRLFPHMSVKRNLTYARWAGWRKKTQSFDDVVSLLGIDHLLSRRPHELSGGEQQRVALGRALLSDPRLLLMDEPLTGLDYERKAEILPYLERLAHEFGIPIIYVSHDLDEIIRLADYLVLLENGRAKAKGPIGEILPKVHGQFAAGVQTPVSLISASFQRIDHIYGMTVLSCGRQEFIVPIILQEQTTPYRVRIDSRDVALALSRPDQTSMQNILSGKIMIVEKVSESAADISVNIDGQVVVSRVTLKAVDELNLKVEQQVFLMVKSVAVDGVTSRPSEG